jgi:23S rRNA pseudoU1915 N3-methylase RlmH
MKDFDLAGLIAADSSTYTAGFKIDNPAEAGKQAMALYIKGAKLDSEALSSSIGDNKSVTFNFTAQVGGPEDTLAGLFIQGGEALS